MTNSNRSIFTDEIAKKCELWLQKYPKDRKRSAVIEILKIVQKANGGYLNENLISAVADYLNISRISVYEVATFYSMFDLNKVGKYKICLCISVSCMLCSSDEILEYIKKKLSIDINETTKDGKFTLKKVECLAACGGAPVMQIGEEYYESLTPEKVDSILDSLE